MEKEMQYGVRSSDLETVPMQADTHCNKSSETRDYKTIQSQIARSVCVSAAYMILGWTKGQIGPAFPDIMMISGADLEKGSAFMTSLYTGQLFGSVMAGFIYPKMNKYLLFGFALVLYSLTVAVIPWCFLYELMVAAFTFLGVCGGMIGVGIGAEIVAIWGPTPRGRSFIMANSAAYSIASVLSPLVTAPFLLKQSVYTPFNTNDTTWNITYIHTDME
ncbi:sodium-dependent glucose transporter 1-like [Pecten maximus]|uniref:sodium-dependent glucose transporter 1-like n=1 Tax=Pecten maximus TaxID=6579 RepID=UPI001457EB90|nr:sodium-dependent glucose transporter 1-like [Pecten maximus]